MVLPAGLGSVDRGDGPAGTMSRVSEPGVEVFETACGVIALRPERPQDQTFLYALFASEAGAVLRSAALSDVTAEQIVRMQHRSKQETYRARFPDATYAIVEWRDSRSAASCETMRETRSTSSTSPCRRRTRGSVWGWRCWAP